MQWINAEAIRQFFEVAKLNNMSVDFSKRMIRETLEKELSKYKED